MPTFYFEPKAFRRLSRAQQWTLRELAKCEEPMAVVGNARRTLTKLHDLGLATFDKVQGVAVPTEKGLSLVAKRDQMQVNAHKIMSAFAGKAGGSDG